MLAASQLLRSLQLERHFPTMCCAIAYGSGVFPQQTDTASASDTTPLIDLLFVVEDAVSWHRDNLNKNRRHYSGLRLFGPEVIARVQQGYGAQLYYHTNVAVAGRRVKYGVVTRRDLVNDLLCWRHLYAAGRLQKPTAQQSFGDLRSAEHRELSAALTANRRAALATALLCQPASFDLDSLFETITRLSYTGDIRMGVAEDQHKVRNIVFGPGGLQAFTEVYVPLLEELPFSSVVEAATSGACCQTFRFANSSSVSSSAKVTPLLSPEHLSCLGEALPAVVLADVNDVASSANAPHGSLPVGAWWQTADVGARTLRVQQRIACIVGSSSRTQAIKGVLSAGLSTSCSYVLRKVKKRLHT